MISNEELYFYSLSLTTGFVSMDEYKVWLHQAFLEDDTQNDILYELELRTGSLHDTLSELNYYLYDKIPLLNFNTIKTLIASASQKTLNLNPDSMMTVTRHWYRLWKLLPNRIAHEEPFFLMSYIDDAWLWGDHAKNRQAILDFISNQSTDLERHNDVCNQPTQETYFQPNEVTPMLQKLTPYRVYLTIASAILTAGMVTLLGLLGEGGAAALACAALYLLLGAAQGRFLSATHPEGYPPWYGPLFIMLFTGLSPILIGVTLGVSPEIWEGWLQRLHHPAVYILARDRVREGDLGTMDYLLSFLMPAILVWLGVLIQSKLPRRMPK
jgi:hypothetical protein